MCLFRSPQPTPLPQPQVAFQPRVTPQKQESEKPEKKDLLDPDQPAEVQYGSGAKKGSPGAGKKTGTDALKINVNTGSAGGGSGGINTP